MVYDNKGTDQTYYFPNTPYTVELLADDLAALLKALKISESVYVVGYSIGGFAAQYLAVKFPNKVRGLILCSTCTKQPEEAKVYLKKRLKLIDEGVLTEIIFCSALP